MLNITGIPSHYSNTTVFRASSSLISSVATAPSLNLNEDPPSTTKQASHIREQISILENRWFLTVSFFFQDENEKMTKSFITGSWIYFETKEKISYIVWLYSCSVIL